MGTRGGRIERIKIITVRRTIFRLEDSGDQVQALAMHARLFLPALAVILFAGTAFAQSPRHQGPFAEAESTKKPKEVPNSGVPDDINITVDFIAVPKSDAFLMVRLSAEEMWAKALEMVQAGTAKSVYMTSATGNSEKRMVLESIEEFRYPSDFRPPNVPGEGWEVEAKIPDLESVRSILKSLVALTEITAFETRNTGTTLEVEPKVHQNRQWIDLHIIPTRTRFDRFETYRVVENVPEVRYLQPVFWTHRATTAITVQNGKPYFVGAFDASPAGKGEDADKTFLVFLTAKTVY